MKKFKLIPVFAITVLLFSSCKKTQHQACPDNTSVLSWEKTPYSYGTWKLEQEGFNGTSKDGQTDLKKSCDWTLYGSPLDGDGLNPVRTFCISLPPNNAVIFTWASGGLAEFDFNQQWQGTTAEGIKMGDPLSKFQQTYPEFKLVSPGTTIITYLFPSNYGTVGAGSSIWKYSGSNSYVLAAFTSTSPNGVLIGLTVAQ